jgi:hypothetical protein
MSMITNKVMWTLEQGRQVVTEIQDGSRRFNYHVALGGGVLNNGISNKDLDIYFLPLDNGNEPDPEGVKLWLSQVWGRQVLWIEPICPSDYPEDEKNDSAYSEKLKYQLASGQRIDVFII